LKVAKFQKVLWWSPMLQRDRQFLKALSEGREGEYVGRFFVNFVITACVDACSVACGHPLCVYVNPRGPPATAFGTDDMVKTGS
jgi:hypothetical protein